MGKHRIDRALFGGALREVGGHVEVYEDGNREWRWRRVSDNGQVVAGPQEGYVNKSECIEMSMRLFPTVIDFLEVS